MASGNPGESRWDQRLIVWSAILVPYPIVSFYLCRNLGLSVGTSEDIVTLLVMLPLGGPHVAATMMRTIFSPEYRRGERGALIASWLLFAFVAGTAIASVFLGVRILGFVPMQLLLTGFFFWASFHILQQTAFCASSYATKNGKWDSMGRLLDLAVIFGSLYPLAFFRMAMIDGSSPEVPRADPNSLATRVVLSLGASGEFADDYVFRIGRTVPIIPAIARLDMIWVGALVVYLGIVAAWGARAARQWRDGTLEWNRFQLVAFTGGLGFLVPLVPNLDSAFQGMNAWHCAQYLRLSWRLHADARARGAQQSRIARWFTASDSAARFYWACVAGTVAVVSIMLGLAAGISYAGAGRWPIFGASSAELAAAGVAPGVYSPGSLLIAYYLFGFGLLLMHYLQDSWLFLRRGSLDPKIRDVMVGAVAIGGVAGKAGR
jgi:hypothetical protein